MNRRLVDFFSTQSVKEKIIKNTLPEGQLFLYFYLILTFDAFNFLQEGLMLSKRLANTSDLIQMWGVFLLSAVGLIVMFIVNGGLKGKAFLAKFFAFSFTVGIKYAIIFAILSSLPSIITIYDAAIYNICLFAFLNISMLTHITYRIYQTR